MYEARLMIIRENRCMPECRLSMVTGSPFMYMKRIPSEGMLQRAERFRWNHRPFALRSGNILGRLPGLAGVSDASAEHAYAPDEEALATFCVRHP